MRTSWSVAVLVLMAMGDVAAAQPPTVPTSPPLLPPLPPVNGDPLPPPAQPGVPLAVVPRPEADVAFVPDQPPELARPLGRWWISPSVEMTWASTSSAPGAVRLPIPDQVALSEVVTGPVFPIGGRRVGRFDAGLGLTAGGWFDAAATHGIDASLFLRASDSTYEGWARGLAILPPGRGRHDAHILPVPGPGVWPVVTYFPVTLSTFFATADVNYRHRLVEWENARLDAMIGYRVAGLTDDLYFGTADGRDAPDGDYRRNRAAASNVFHGGQVGLAGEVRANGWYASGNVKVAFGGMSSEATATGLFIGAEGETRRGYRRLEALRAPGRTEFAVVPSFGVQLGRQLTPHARVYVGYSFLYLDRVARLGDVLDPGATELPSSYFWIQSIGFGLELRF